MSCRHRSGLLAAVALVIVTAGCADDESASDAPATDVATAPTTSPSSVPAGPVTESLVVPAPSLEGNLLEDPAELRVSVWLPASYATSTARYPVVYFLAGFQEAASTAELGTADLQRLVDEGTAPEMILVGVSGDNDLGGSFYVDSPVTGDWATAIQQDLVGAIDEQYRTIAEPASRGIAGFSMGGFGALDLAMRHPDVFGSVYALSPGLFAPGGMETSQMFDDPSKIEDYLAMQEAVQAGEDGGVMGEGARFALAYGSAFSPDVEGGAPWVAYPYTTSTGPPDPKIWAVWEAGFGGIEAEVEAFADNLRQLRGIALDVGTNDRYAWIPDGVEHLAEQLAANGIDAQVTTYEGGHGPVGPRAEAVMLPFFATVLEGA